MSKLPFELFLALRYLRPRRNFVSVITLISVVGVTLGVAVLIIVISVMSGYDRKLHDQIIGLSGPLQLIPDSGRMAHYDSVVKALAGQPEVTGVAPYVGGKVFLKTEPNDGRRPLQDVPLVRGIDPETEGKVSVLPRSIKEGAFDLTGDGVLVGRILARRMGIRVGDRVAITTPVQLNEMLESRKEGGERVILADDFEVRGIFDVDYYELNANLVVVSLENAQNFFGLGNSVHGLTVMIRDPYQADLVRNRLRGVVGEENQLSTWEEGDAAEFLEALRVEKNVMLYILFFIVVVAAFGITSSLITFVVQKTREIGLLKALGAGRREVMRVFLAQSLIVGVMGVCCGFGLGMLGVVYRNEFLRFMRWTTGWDLFPAKVYIFSELPAMILPRDIALICVGSLLICVLAGLLPAWNAGRLRPVEALQHD